MTHSHLLMCEPFYRPYAEWTDGDLHFATDLDYKIL